MASKAASEHEMTETAPDSMATALLSSDERDASRGSSTLRSPKIRDFLRHTRLQILGKVFGRFSNWRQEPRKVAIHCSRQVAAFHCLLHMIPLGGAIALLTLRWTHHWVGFDPPDATTLQFVAKFHELLMQLSIVEIVHCIVRSEATRGFVPLGVLSGALQATQLSYLWSLDFLSMFTSDAFRGRRWHKAGIIIAIPALLISTALVGPSSAVLMIPEPGCPKDIWSVDRRIRSPETVFRTQLGLADGLDMHMSTTPTLQRFRMRAANNLRDGRNESEISVSDPGNNDRILRLSVDPPMSPSMVHGLNYSESVTQVTAVIPTTFANEELMQRIKSRTTGATNVTAILTMPQPVTTVTCISRDYEGGVTSEDVNYVQKDGTSIGFLDNMSSMARQFNRRTLLDKWVNQHFGPLWLPSPEPDSQASVVVFISVEISNATKPQSLSLHLAQSGSLVTVTTCSLSAFWTTAQAIAIVDQGRLLPTQARPISELELRDVKNITLNVTGIPVITDPAFGVEMEPNSFAGCRAPVDLAVAFALAISDLPLFGNVSYEYDNALFNPSTEYGTAELRVFWYAYGYCTDSTSVRLSLAVILAYCIITSTYLLYILVTGSTSTAWNSAIELVALALQSRKPDYTGRIAVGIDTLDTFNQGVGIRVNNDNELELVFASDRDIDSRGLRRIEKNHVY